MRYRFRLAARAVIAVSAGAALTGTLTVLPAVDTPVHLLADTVIGMGGNDDPDGAYLDHGLNGYFNPGSANYAFPGYRVVKVPWTSDSFDGDPGYETSQSQGLEALHVAIGRQFAEHPDDDVVVTGYSASANVVIREMRRLDSAGSAAPPPGQLRFVVAGNPHRPNGGLFARFRGLQLGTIAFDGANPDTAYALTDIAYEYDPISDFPLYPLPLTLLNSFAAWQLHIDYSGPNADVGNAVDDPAMTYTAPDGTTYVTLAAPRLPLLMPLHQTAEDNPAIRPALKPALALAEPTLKVLVDLGYDRSIPVGEDTRMRFVPRHDPVRVVRDLVGAAGEGLRDARDSAAEESADARTESDTSDRDNGAPVRSASTAPVARSGSGVERGPAGRETPDDDSAGDDAGDDAA